MNKRFTALKTLTSIAPRFWSGRISQPVFVLGCARSGTTLLANLLSLHRDVADWSEANEVWDPTGHPWNKSGRETLPVWIDPDAFMARWWRDTEPRCQEIRAVFAAYQVLQGKSRFSNKTPYNTLRIPQVLDIFPDAKLINLVRDGRAVVHSYTRREIVKTTKWAQVYEAAGVPRTKDEIAVRLAEFWKHNVDEVLRQDAELDLSASGRLLHVTYEDLCTDTSATLDRICQFAGLDPQRFDHRVHDVATPSQNFKWRTEFDESFVKELVAIMEPTFSNLGYRT